MARLPRHAYLDDATRRWRSSPPVVTAFGTERVLLSSRKRKGAALDRLHLGGDRPLRSLCAGLSLRRLEMDGIDEGWVAAALEARRARVVLSHTRRNIDVGTDSRRRHSRTGCAAGSIRDRS